MTPRHVRHPKRDFRGFVAAMVVVFFLSGALGFGFAAIARLIYG